MKSHTQATTFQSLMQQSIGDACFQNVADDTTAASSKPLTLDDLVKFSKAMDAAKPVLGSAKECGNCKASGGAIKVRIVSRSALDVVEVFLCPDCLIKLARVTTPVVEPLRPLQIRPEIPLTDRYGLRSPRGSSPQKTTPQR